MQQWEFTGEGGGQGDVMIAALVLLGLGWNAGLLAGTAMLVDATSSATRARTQGTCDVLVALAGAGGGIGAGFVAGATTYATLCCLTVVAAVALLAFVPRRKSA